MDLLENHIEGEREVRTFEVYIKCSDCNCSLSFNRNLIKNNQTFYVHKCLRCGNECVKDKKYPHIKYN